MPKPKNKDKRNIVTPKTIQEPEIIGKNKKKQDVRSANRNQGGNEHFLLEKVLIVCEGSTEAAYFEGLCAIFELNNKFVLEILPSKDSTSNNDGYKGSSVKSLLYMAMQEEQKQEYDHIWIVTDNDEGNAYELDDNSLRAIQNVVPTSIYQKLKTKQIKVMDVRQAEIAKGEHERKRYFLSKQDYEHFLTQCILMPNELPYLNTIVENTIKKEDFTQLYSQDWNAIFLDKAGKFIEENSKNGEKTFEKQYFLPHLLKEVKVAYSCIAFEHWILLHFEVNETAFYNSREIIHYFDTKKYFNGNYDKGWYLYKNRENITIKQFFHQASKAIINNICLNTAMQPQLTQGKNFYEVNPYSDIYKLTTFLFKTENIELAFLNTPISHPKLELTNIQVTKSQNLINITFVFERNKSVLTQEIEKLFSVENKKGISVLATITVLNKGIIQKGNPVNLEISIKNNTTSPSFLYLKDMVKGEKYTIIWQI